MSHEHSCCDSLLYMAGCCWPLRPLSLAKDACLLQLLSMIPKAVEYLFSKGITKITSCRLLDSARELLVSAQSLLVECKVAAATERSP